MVTVYDVAQACGLSIASVSRALNGRGGVSAETAERVREVARTLGYEPNEVARSLVAGSTKTIAVLVPDITNPFFPELVKGVQSVADSNDLLLLLVDAPNDVVLLADRLTALRRRNVDGVILVGSEVSGDLDVLESLTPIVFLDRAPTGARARVGIDQEGAAWEATQHLISLGHVEIAHITGPADLHVSQQRTSGWRRACADSGLVGGDDLVVAGDFTEQGGYRAAAALFEGGRTAPTAIFAANDLSAIGVLSYCASHAISVPHDVSVMGLDGIELARHTSPELSTIAQPIRELGRAAGELLLTLIGSGGAAMNVSLPVKLVPGASVRKRAA